MKEETFILLWLATTLADAALLTYNAALNRPAYQTSVYFNPTVNGTWNANLANDGIHETHAYKDRIARCAHTQVETNPWWAVELGRPTTIYRVDFTNREDGSSMYSYSVCNIARFSHSSDQSVHD